MTREDQVGLVVFVCIVVGIILALLDNPWGVAFVATGFLTIIADGIFWSY